jgi:hypothetical protein
VPGQQIETLAHTQQLHAAVLNLALKIKQQRNDLQGRLVLSYHQECPTQNSADQRLLTTAADPPLFCTLMTAQLQTLLPEVSRAPAYPKRIFFAPAMPIR